MDDGDRSKRREYNHNCRWGEPLECPIQLEVLRARLTPAQKVSPTNSSLFFQSAAALRESSA
jgi:hypothetical protein